MVMHILSVLSLLEDYVVRSDTRIITIVTHLFGYSKVGGARYYAIARPFTNHSTGRITSPARRRKCLVAVQHKFHCIP